MYFMYSKKQLVKYSYNPRLVHKLVSILVVDYVGVPSCFAILSRIKFEFVILLLFIILHAMI